MAHFWTSPRVQALFLFPFILLCGLPQGVERKNSPRDKAEVHTNSVSDNDEGNLLHKTALTQQEPPSEWGILQEAQVKNYSGWRLLQVFIPSRENLQTLLEVLEASKDVVMMGAVKEKSRVVVKMAVSSHTSVPHLLKSSRYHQHDSNHLVTHRAAENNTAEEGGGENHQDVGDYGEAAGGVGEGLDNRGDTATGEGRGGRRQQSLAWDDYYRYPSIVTFARGLAEQRATVECLNLGHTTEGRPLLALIIATDIGCFFSARRMAQVYRRKILSARRHRARGHPQQTYSTQKNAPREEGNGVINQITKKKNPEEAGGKKTIVKELNRKRNMVTRRNRADRQRLKNLRNKEIKLNKTEPRKGVEKTFDNQKLKNKIFGRRNGSMGTYGGTKRKSRARHSKPVILVEAGAHAREWISHAVATFLAQQLADAGKVFLRHVSFIIVPAINPDGYEFTHTNDRLWRKNRRPGNRTGCYGVDLNRNWGTAWDTGAGSSDNLCSEIYRGSHAFSEIETQSLANLAWVFRKTVKMFLSFHSFGEYVLYPWGYTMEKPAKKAKLKKMAKKIADRLNINNMHFQYGQSSRLLYLASGTAEDYMYNLGVPFTYTIELPKDTFILPPEYILPVASDVWDAVVCTVGDLAKTERAKSFCNKKLVKVQDHGNKILKGWINKGVPMARAEEIVRERHATR
ncbi:Carboxypeptidase B-like 7 [Homarus americanus]|uniref:Carboxypeptidase B-like 7 n=1 Tax=Homarus americanus TaxID=6706 RepID=A0A8J5JT93_HOMAM|nr:Carboxypeptidase B-like 7 [Homarus americanus]